MKKIPLKFHLLFWIILIILGVATLSPYYFNLFKATMHRIVFIPVWFVATYTNLYILLPKLWDRGLKWIYIVCLVSLILFLTIIQRIWCIKYIYPTFFWMRPPNANEINPLWIEPLVQFAGFITLPVILSIGIRQTWKWYNESYKAKQIIAEQQEAELHYLKAQVNPHFLFNTLNNLYGLSLESSDKVPNMILKLSDLLSYTLYESNVKTVTLRKEMALVYAFIDLEKERFQNRVDVKIKIEDNVNMDIEFSPLIILPLVENAFKHGVRHSEKTVSINIYLNQINSKLVFKIENPIPMLNGTKDEKIGGMGLQNLKRRFELSYKDNYELIIDQNDNHFKVNLSINTDA